jgi:hypothetical protein
MSRSWLAGAFADEGALVVPGVPARNTATVRLTEEAVLVSMRTATGRLDWRSYPALDASSRPDAWTVVPWTGGRGGLIGVGLAANGASRTAASSVIEAAKSLRSRLNRMFIDNPASIPLCTTRHISPADKERATFGALVCLLATRPDLRTRLNEPSRLASLAAEIGPGALLEPTSHFGIRRSTRGCPEFRRTSVAAP